MPIFCLNIFYSKGANVAFLENVHLLFSVGYKNVSSPENIKLLVWRESEGIHVDKLTKGTEDYVLSTLKNPPEGLYADSVAFEFLEIAAAEMTENVYVRAYYNDGEGEYLSPVIKYSILQYAMNKLGYTGTVSENAKLRAMLVGMLEYGALAQDYFGVRTDRMANELYVEVTLKGAEGFTPHIGQDGQGDFSYPYSERLDDFIIYDSALTADEVARLAAYYGINVNAAE